MQMNPDNEAPSVVGGATGPGIYPVAFDSAHEIILMSNMSHFSFGIGTAI